MIVQGIPVSIEELEETIQDHREFLLNLDSHKAMALSINFIGQLNPLQFKGSSAEASPYVPTVLICFLGFFDFPVPTGMSHNYSRPGRVC